MSVTKKINPKFIHTINFNNHENGKSIIGTIQAKIIRIQGQNDLQHPLMREAVELITNEEFSKNFLKAGKTFAISVIVNGSLIPLDVQQLTSLQSYKDRPTILYFENIKGDFCVYYKDKKSKNFKYLSKITEISIETFFNSEFTFELLLRALKSNFCGSFNGKFLDTSISSEPLIENYRLIDLAVMGNEVLCVRFLQLFENNLENLGVQSLRLLQHAARSCDVEGFLSIFDLNFDRKEIKSKINNEILSVRDPSGYNLLMIASEHSNIEGVMFLLNLSIFDVNYEVDGVTAASLASASEILLMLLQNDSKYPKNFHKIIKTEELKHFTRKISELHKFIREGNQKCAKEILYNFRLRYFFNECNKSASYLAVECKEFKIYEFLLMNDSTIAPFENLQDILLDEGSKNYLKILHDKYKSPLYEKCVLDVEKKVKCINVSEIDRRKFQFEFRNALNILYDVENFQPVLQITAAADVEITMDFERSSVNFLDPSEVKTTRGYFGNGAILIGAKDLFDDDLKNLFLATFIHELTHFVINFLYRNQCRPYHAMDQKRANDFKIIHRLCNKSGEKLIETVYGYHESLQHSELIARPNHLTAFYYDNEVMRRESEENYEELFRFYKERIYIDMISALEWIESDKKRAGSSERNERNKKRKYGEIYKEICDERIPKNKLQIMNKKSNSDVKFKDCNLANNFMYYENFEILDGPKLSLSPSETFNESFIFPEYKQNLYNRDKNSLKPLLEPEHNNQDKFIHQFEPQMEEEPKHNSKLIKNAKLGFFLFIAITLVLAFLLYLMLKPENNSQSLIQALNDTSCFNHPWLKFIESKNVESLEKTAESLDLWGGIDSNCNILAKCIDLHHNDTVFFEELVHTAKEAFKNCEGKFKRLLISTEKNILDNERIVKIIKDILNDLLDGEDHRKYLNGNFDDIGKEC